MSVKGSLVHGEVDGAGWQARLRTPFVVATGVAVALGAAVRLLYIANFPSVVPYVILGDGFAYSIEANFLADGVRYVDPFNPALPSAHHPPGWLSALGVVSRLGFRSVHDHQIFGALLGLVLIVVAGFLARRIFGDATGAVAALLVAVYPGFWVLEAQVLSETLGLILLGLFTVSIYQLRLAVTVGRLVVAAALAGLAALTRSEQLVTAGILMAVVLITAPGLSIRRRASYGLLVAVIVGSMLAPWAVYNSSRFEEPVVLSTNMGSTLLAGNCSFRGPTLGYFDRSCADQIAFGNPAADRSVLDRLNRAAAIDNIGDNLGRMPIVIPARIGRTLAVFMPADTVGRVAEWHGTETWPIWLWVVSFWILLPLAGLGAIVARRRGIWILPLVVPIAVALVIVVAFYGEPRYHTPADLSFVLLAAYALVESYRRLRLRGGPT